MIAMKTTSIVAVWLLLVAGVTAETVVYYTNPGGYATETAIGLIATAGAITTATFSMSLKDEDMSLRFMILIPVALVTVLAVSMLFAYPVNF